MTTDAQVCSGVIDDEAIAWFVRMRGADATAIQSEFDAWLRRGDGRKEAYEKAARLFEGAAVLKQSARPLDKPRRHMEPFAAQRRPAWAFAAMALLCAALGMAIWKFALAPTGSKIGGPVNLITERGQIRTFRLVDGTAVTLDTRSKVEVIDPEQRHLRIVAGRVRIAVADGQKPMVVDAGAGRVSSRSGAFDVTMASNKVAIALLRGRAEATTLDRLSIAGFFGRTRELAPNRVLSYGSRSFADAVFQPAPRDPARSWPTGWNEYPSIPLADLVAQANRYAAKPIVLDDAMTGRREVAGRFQLAETAAFTQRIAELFDLVIIRDERSTHLRPR
jgi:transmembrane sensor